ncbi:hypothetical protein [Glutamicibacter soli]
MSNGIVSTAQKGSAGMPVRRAAPAATAAVPSSRRGKRAGPAAAEDWIKLKFETLTAHSAKLKGLAEALPEVSSSQLT